MKKLLLTTLILLSPIFVLTSVQAQEIELTNEVMPVYQEQLDLLRDVITKQKEYIDLRSDGFIEIQNTSKEIEDKIEQDLSDLSTRIIDTENDLEKITTDGYERTLSQAHTELIIINQELVTINREHLDLIKEDIYNTNLEVYSESVSSLNILFEENKDDLKSESFKESEELLEKSTDLVSDLTKNYSEGNWARLEEKLSQLVSKLDDLSSEILPKTD